MKFAVLSGLRLGEIMDLRWKNVDRDNNQILIESSEEFQVKGGKFRTLPVNNDAMKILIKQGQTSDWIFTRNGKKFYGEYVSKKFKEYLRICNLREELHFHCLRATCATWALTAGAPIVAVRDMLGHSSVKTTEHYASYELENLREEVEKISLPTMNENKKNRTPMKLVYLKPEQNQ